MTKWSSLLKKEDVPKILFDKIHLLQQLLLRQMSKEKLKNLVHITDLKNAYTYIYYVMLVDYFLKKEDKEGLIVDWGGFVGQVTMLLNHLGYNCENYVLDYPNEELTNLINENFEDFKIKFKKKDVNVDKFSYKDESCLAVLSSGVLEHVYESNVSEETYLREIYRVLKPGGYFFCWNLPRKLSLLENICKIRKKGAHEVSYYDGAFKKLLQKSGFQIRYFSRQDDILKIVRPVRNLINAKDYWQGLNYDIKFSQLPLINLLAHHITVVCQKK